jgi:RNA polymerase sigma-70 factor (ECF subfamily)
VYALCARLTDDQAAADLLQETFLRVWKYRGSLAGTARFSTWLYTVTRNVCMDHLRQSAREREFRSALASSQEPMPHAGSDGVADLRGLVRDAVSALPATVREALVLSRFHGLSYEEIGRICGCSEGAVKVRVHRAMKQLRAALLSREKAQ